MGKVKILKLENDKVEMGCDEILDTIENGDFIFLYIPEYGVMTYPRMYSTSDGPEPPRGASEEPDKVFGFCDIHGTQTMMAVLEDGSTMFFGGSDSGNETLED